MFFILWYTLFRDISNSLARLADTQEQINNETLEHQIYKNTLQIDDSYLSEEQLEVLSRF